MVSKAPPGIERQHVVRISAAARAVGRLRRKDDSCQWLRWRDVFRPIDRGILDGSVCQVDTKLGAKLVFRRILAEVLNDRVKHGIVGIVARLACEPDKGFGDGNCAEPRDVIAKAERAFGIEGLP